MRLRWGESEERRVRRVGEGGDEGEGRGERERLVRYRRRWLTRAGEKTQARAVASETIISDGDTDLTLS